MFRSFQSFKKGFTLAELMLVIAIIGVLVAVMYPLITGYMERARDNSRMNALKSISLGLATFVRDMDAFPRAVTQTTATFTQKAGCIPRDVLQGKYLTNIPTSPKGVLYNEGCGDNGEYGYGAYNQGDAYILMATMERNKAGNILSLDPNKNYVGEVEKNTYETLQRDISEKSGKYFFLIGELYKGIVADSGVLASHGGSGNNGGNSGSTPPPPSPIPPTPPMSVPNSCGATLQDGYTIGPMNHGESIEVNKTISGQPNNGSTTTTAIATCSDGNVSITPKTSNITCDTNYFKRGNACEPTTQTCNIGSGDTRGTGTQTYDAHRGDYGICQLTSCDNATLAKLVNNSCKLKEQSCNITNGTGVQRLQNDGTYSGACEVITCNSNFHKEGNACVSNTKSCTIENGTGTQTHNGTSWGSCEVASCNTGYTKNNTTNTCEVVCESSIYLDTNGVTVKAKECAEAEREYELNGERYYVARDKSDIQNKINQGYPANRIVTTKVTSMNSLFLGNNTFNQDISNWDVSNVTNMESMFNGATVFNRDIGNWDTSKVTNMESMFNGATAFNGNIENWNTSKVTDMSWMFFSTHKFDQNIGNWNTSKVTDMSGMFMQAYEFDQNIGNWNTSKVTDMSWMFAYAKAFNQNIESWDTSKVTNMSYMFNGATAFNGNMENWDVSNVTDMGGMFGGATAFNGNIENWDVSNVTDMDGMFYRASKFDQDLSSWCVRNISSKPRNFDSSTHSGFKDNSSKQPRWGTCPSSNIATESPIYIDTNGVTIKARDFAEAGKEYEFNGENYYVARDKEDIKQKIASGYQANRIVTSKVVDMSNLFRGNHEFNQAIGNWDVSNVTNMSYMFASAYYFNQSLINWDVSNVTNMDGMFYYAKLFNGYIYMWCTKNINLQPNNFDVFSYFEGEIKKQPKWGSCPNITQIYIDTNGVTIKARDFAEAGKEYEFNGERYYVARDKNDIKQKIASGYQANRIITSKVTDMSNLFRENHEFNQAIGNWDVSNVTNMSYMFSTSYHFNQSLANWNVSRVTNMDGMFYYSTAFKQNISSWCVKNINSKPNNFNYNASVSFEYDLSKQPQWGTCPSR